MAFVATKQGSFVVLQKCLRDWPNLRNEKGQITFGQCKTFATSSNKVLMKKNSTKIIFFLLSAQQKANLSYTNLAISF